MPGTVVLAALLIVAAVLSGGLVTPSAQQSWFGDIGYGIPAIQNGVWWTPITGTFLVTDPPAYLYPLVFVPLGMGWLEWRRGTRVAVFWFVVGQLFAIVATLVLLAIAAPAGSAWAAGLAALYDAGASGGLFACFAAAVCTLPLPWRPRAQLALASFSIISVLFLGTLGDVQRAAAVALVLAVHLREFGRPTIRERRFTAWVLVVAVGAAQFIISFIPTDGPFGVTVPGGGSVADVVIDAVVVLLIANGLRLGYRVAWIVAIVLAVLNVLVGIAAVALLTLAPTEVADARDDLSLAAATAFLWLLALLYLLYTRTAFRARLRRRVPDASAQRGGDVRQIVMQTGGGALSWMATWRDNAHFYGSDPDTVVAFQTHSGVAIALSDPIAPWREKRFTLAEWVAATEKAGFIPCVFGASEHAREIRPEGWKALQIAEDTIVDLPGLEFTGKRWNTVRTALNRAGRETMTFRLTALADEPHAVRRQIDAISEQWVGEKDLPEMRFTLGAVDEALDPAVRVALAETADGTVDGFLSWLPIYGPGGVVRGYTLDLMRRRDGGFPPVMEFLIASSAAAFRDEGAEIMSLSGAPLAHSGPAGDGVVEKALERIGAALEPVYGFRSLHKFKQKFNPRAEPIYLLFAEEADLPAIGLGITRAFLPDASLADLVRAGADAVRSAR
ncbi:DUF2156 domain-containing protein [Microbacteriaceae bacterium VKM Ac-2855]|nr:DUF2156 domain-containing protein [Microbacteriaceae bacterium VKM Ac-2855]